MVNPRDILINMTELAKHQRYHPDKRDPPPFRLTDAPRPKSVLPGLDTSSDDSQRCDIYIYDDASPELGASQDSTPCWRTTLHRGDHGLGAAGTRSHVDLRERLAVGISHSERPVTSTDRWQDRNRLRTRWM